MAKSNTTQHKGWGGDWTEEKLDCFEKYVRAYLTIMNKHRDKFNWKLMYFDGFAGCGDRQITCEEETSVSLFGDEEFDTKELQVYQGAAERVLKIEKDMRGFDYYYFIDMYEENLTHLELKLAKYQTKGQKVYRPGDANSWILELVNYLKSHSKTKVLCLLDPFGMNIQWKSIVAIAGTGVDLWILVPTGIIVNRLIQNNGKLRYPDKLEEFFGLPAQAISDRFYREEESQSDLFSNEHKEVKKVKNVIQEIAQLYKEQLGNLFDFVTPKPLALLNSKGVPIFHFFCASNNLTAVKIAHQIFDKKQSNR